MRRYPKALNIVVAPSPSGSSPSPLSSISTVSPPTSPLSPPSSSTSPLSAFLSSSYGFDIPSNSNTINNNNNHNTATLLPTTASTTNAVSTAKSYKHPIMNLLVDIESNKPSVTSLRFVYKRLGPIEAELIANALEKNTNVEIVRLDSNMLGDRGVQVLANCLAVCILYLYR